MSKTGSDLRPSTKRNTNFSVILLILPSIILAAFGLFIVDYSFRGWFSDRISTAINESVKVAEDYLSEHTRSVRGSILEMVNDINREAPKLEYNMKEMRDCIFL